jgi:hypothetical protein
MLGLEDITNVHKSSMGGQSIVVGVEDRHTPDDSMSGQVIKNVSTKTN